MRFLRPLYIIPLILGTTLFLWSQNQYLREVIRSYVENGEFLTLEASILPEKIMEENASTLIRGDGYTYRPPTLQFHPYLLMDVKYTPTGKHTREGKILWSLVDGEMVIDTLNWQKTHGFQDAIDAKANYTDFVILNALASSQKGTLSKDFLKRALDLDEETLSPILDSLRKKQLIVQRGEEIFLHFENPHFLVPPQTYIHQWLVTKPYVYAQRIKPKYSIQQVQQIAKAAFGHNFTIRYTKKVFVPVYHIEVENPDRSKLSSYWNGINGKKMDI